MQSIIIIAGWQRFLAIRAVFLHSINCAAKDNNNTALLETSNNLSGLYTILTAHPKIQ